MFKEDDNWRKGKHQEWVEMQAQVDSLVFDERKVFGPTYAYLKDKYDVWPTIDGSGDMIISMTSAKMKDPKVGDLVQCFHDINKNNFDNTKNYQRKGLLHQAASLFGVRLKSKEPTNLKSKLLDRVYSDLEKKEKGDKLTNRLVTNKMSDLLLAAIGKYDTKGDVTNPMNLNDIIKREKNKNPKYYSRTVELHLMKMIDKVNDNDIQKVRSKIVEIRKKTT